MTKIHLQLIVGIVYQFPYGLPDAELEKHLKSSLDPLVKFLYQSRFVHLTLYIPGYLLRWIENRYPEYVLALREMIAKKQIELLGGGYYHPIPSLIPHTDSTGQIEMTTTTMRKLFGKRPYGVWFHDQLWENYYTSFCHFCDMRYTFLQDVHSLNASNEACNPVITENEGKSILVFQTNSQITQLWYEKKITQSIEKLKALHSASPRYPVAVFATHSMLFSHYQSFFMALEKNSSWIETVLPRTLWQQNNQTQKRYFFNREPNSIRATLVVNPQKMFLYAKTQYLNILVNHSRGDKFRRKAARQLIWKSQNGYSYLSAKNNTYGRSQAACIRGAYSSLIEAEHTVRDPGLFSPSIQVIDFDYDGIEEYLFQGKQINCYVHRQGGSIFELDFFASKWNWVDSIRNAPPDVTTHMHHSSQHLSIKAVATNCFVDSIVSAKSLKDIAPSVLYGPSQPSSMLYQVDKLDQKRTLIYLATEWKRENSDICLEIKKRFFFRTASVKVEYRIINRGPVLQSTKFVTSLNMVPSGYPDDTLLLVGHTNHANDTNIPISQNIKLLPPLMGITISAPMHKQEANIEYVNFSEVFHKYDQPHNRYQCYLSADINLNSNEVKLLSASIKLAKRTLARTTEKDN